MCGMIAPMPVTRIHGPIISCADLGVTRHMFEQVFNLKPVAEQALSRDEVQALWGLKGHAAHTMVLDTAGTPFGVRLVQFDPVSPIVIRDPARGFDADALKVIDFYAPDFNAAEAHLKKQGFRLKHDRAEYDLPEGHMIEGHLWGPDEVVCALVSGPKDFFRDFVTVNDRTVSEVQSISSPVSDPDAVLRFYKEVLDLGIVYDYFIDAESFSKLVGTPFKLQLKARNVGVKRSEPYFGIIHYGLPTDAYRSLRERAVFPNRGIAGATVMVTGVQDIAKKAAAFGAEVLAPPARVTLAPHGAVTSLTLRAPHGVIHHLVNL
jgi:catechol 2,3-dioxygenase-like lactoylglutathione lyase family enzyme